MYDAFVGTNFLSWDSSKLFTKRLRHFKMTIVQQTSINLTCGSEPKYLL